MTKAVVDGTVRYLSKPTKTAYYVDPVVPDPKGVIVVEYEGKIQSMMTGDIKYFNNMP